MPNIGSKYVLCRYVMYIPKICLINDHICTVNSQYIPEVCQKLCPCMLQIGFIYVIFDICAGCAQDVPEKGPSYGPDMIETSSYTGWPAMFATPYFSCPEQPQKSSCLACLFVCMSVCLSIRWSVCLALQKNYLYILTYKQIVMKQNL